MKKALSLAVACCAALPLMAIDAYWSDITSTTGVWTNLTNWLDADGNALDAPPTNIEDSATFPLMLDKNTARQDITMRRDNLGDRVVKDGPYIPMSVGTVTGGGMPRHRIIPNASSSARYPGFTLTLLDPTGFAGIWDPQAATMVFSLGATAESKPTLQNLTTTYRPEVNVPTAGTTARVGNLFEFGTLVKSGSGKLEIGTTTGNDMKVVVKGGSVSFDGTHVSDAEVDALLADAFIHLDASAEDTLTTTTLPGHGARLFVTNWTDVRGEGYPHAWAMNGTAIDINSKEPIESAVLNPPFVSDYRQRGLTLVDFGSRQVSDIATLGPTNCILEFTRSGTKIREVFMAMQRTDTVSYGAFLGNEHGDNYFIPPSSSYKQFVGGSSHVYVRYGNITANGFRLPDYLSNMPVGDFRDFHTFSFAASDNIEAYYIASDRRVWGRTGGMRLGEMVIFTNTLTRAQRIAIERRLNEKWVASSGLPEADVGFLSLGNAAAGAVEVAGGSVVVRELRTDSGRIVKSGPGELVVGNVYPSTSTVQVVEGKISVVANKPVTTSAPADGAYIWLDASDPTTYADYIHTEEGNPTNYITAMKDVRNNGTNATTWASAVVPRLPSIVENAVGGKNAISLGHSARGDQSALIFPNFSSTAANAYAGFIVIRMTGDDEKQDLFGEGGTILTFRRTTKYRLLSNGDYIQGVPPSAIWTVNGVAIDPMEAEVEEMKLPQGTNEFFLVAFSSKLPVCCTALTKKRKFESYPDAMGGYELAECIVYNRPISDQERRNTEAYLMSKWLGKAHPSLYCGVGSVAFANTMQIAFSNDAALAVAALSGGDGTFAKSGSGELSLAQSFSAMANVSSISVSGGTVRGGDGVAEDKLCMHFDASDLSTLEYHTVEELDGSVTTNITAWYDVRNNGLRATSVIQDISVAGNISFTNPTYRAYNTRPGVRRALVDFGQHSSGNDVSKHYATSAGMNLTSRFTNVREVHAIWAAHAEDGRSSAGDILGDSSAYHYTRNRSTILSNNYGPNAPEVVFGGKVEVDCVLTNQFFPVVPEQTYLCSFVPTNNTAVSAFGRDRGNIDGGGGKLGEVYAFSAALTEREHAFLQAKLMHKWFSDDDLPFWTNEYSSVSISNGGALVFDDGVVLSTAALEGDGSITAAAVLAGGFSSAQTGDNEWQHLVINGAFEFEPAASVSIVGLPDARLNSGDYTILSATGGITGFNAANVTVTGLTRNREASVRQVGNDLVVRIYKPGLFIIAE